MSAHNLSPSFPPFDSGFLRASQVSRDPIPLEETKVFGGPQLIMTAEGQGRKTMAIVGSGMAGLVTAYLLQRDRQKRYDVEIFETVNNLLFSSFLALAKIR